MIIAYCNIVLYSGISWSLLPLFGPKLQSGVRFLPRQEVISFYLFNPSDCVKNAFFSSRQREQNFSSFFFFRMYHLIVCLVLFLWSHTWSHSVGNILDDRLLVNQTTQTRTGQIEQEINSQNNERGQRPDQTQPVEICTRYTNLVREYYK